MPRSTSASSAARKLMTIPSIGKAMAADLIRLGVKGIADLKRRDPVALYREISRRDNVWHDPCVLDSFMCAVQFAKDDIPRDWWDYTDERKRKFPTLRGGIPFNAQKIGAPERTSRKLAAARVTKAGRAKAAPRSKSRTDRSPSLSTPAPRTSRTRRQLGSPRT